MLSAEKISLKLVILLNSIFFFIWLPFTPTSRDCREGSEYKKSNKNKIELFTNIYHEPVL